MADNNFDEKGIIKPEYEMSFEQRMSMNTNDDSVDRPKDNITDFGKGRYYLTLDGRKCATLEEAMEYDRMFYEQMKNKIEDYKTLNKIDDDFGKGKHR